MNTPITYRDDAALTTEQAVELYKKSTLGERRPVDKPEVFSGMLKHSNLIITAWRGDVLVGIARSLTDFNYVTYLSDLVVDQDFQRQGIGKQLIAETRQRTPNCMIVLLAAPDANDYYPKLVFTSNSRGWVLKKDE